MDTRDTIFQEALNDLYLSLIKVMRLANGSTTPEQQLQQIISALQNLANNCNAGNIPSAIIETTPATISTKTSASVVAPTPTPAPPPSSAHTFVGEKKYASMPEMRDIDGKWGFRNKYLTTEKNGEPSASHYELDIIDESYATFAFFTDIIESLKSDPGLTPQEVVVFNRSDLSSASKIELVKKGRLVRDGKYWLVTECCEIKLTKD